MLSTAVTGRKRETLRTATGLKNISQRRARFHSSDDRSFVYITISAVEFGARRKKRISIFPWHSTSTSGGIHYRCHCYVREPPLFLSGRMRWEIKVTTSPARAGQTVSLIISLFTSPMTCYRIRDNELQFCTSRSPARGVRIFSRGKFLVNFTISKKKLCKVIEGLLRSGE